MHADTYHNLKVKIRNTPSHIMHMYLRNRIYDLVLDKTSWCKLLKIIPRHIVSIDLSENALYQFDANELTEILQAIPKNVTEINLSINNLGLLNSGRLAKVLQGLHQSVTKVNLSHNNLGNLNADDLIEVLRAIPKQVTQIDLAWNVLYNLDADDLAKALKAIPMHVTQVNLRGNKLSQLGAEGLGKVLKAIPKHVAQVDLGNNNLYEMAPVALATALQDFPKHITQIDLGGVAPQSLRPSGLIKVLKALPRHITYINLSNNRLSTFTTEELAQVLQEIPEHVTEINLSYNRLNHFEFGENYCKERPADEIVMMIKAIPQHLKTVHLDNNSLFAEKYYEQIAAIIQAISKSKLRFTLTGNSGSSPNLDFTKVVPPIAAILVQQPNGPKSTINDVSSLLSSLSGEKPRFFRRALKNNIVDMENTQVAIKNASLMAIAEYLDCLDEKHAVNGIIDYCYRFLIWASCSDKEKQTIEKLRDDLTRYDVKNKTEIPSELILKFLNNKDHHHYFSVASFLLVELSKVTSQPIKEENRHRYAYHPYTPCPKNSYF